MRFETSATSWSCLQRLVRCYKMRAKGVVDMFTWGALSSAFAFMFSECWVRLTHATLSKEREMMLETHALSVSYLCNFKMVEKRRALA